MDFKGTDCEDVDRIRLHEDGVQWVCAVNALVNLRVPRRTGLFDFCVAVRFSTRSLLLGV